MTLKACKGASMIDFDKDIETRHDAIVSIKVVGIGGAGGNTVNSMITAHLQNIDYIVANTDVQALNRSHALKKIQLGKKATRGLGSGANPDLGRRATEEDLDKIMDAIGDADIVFLAAGMGGGTGSGGAPVIAKALKERGILSIAVVTKPFAFEGKRRMAVAQEAIELLKKEVDTLLIVPNQKLLDVVDRSVSMIESFSMIDELLMHSVKSISDIITQSGHINVDFADLRAIMKGMGLAMMGAGCAQGQDRAKVAAQQAISSHLLESMDIKQARGILLNITGGTNLSLHEINDAASVIYDQSNENAHIIVGSVIDQSMGDKVLVSVIVTGFESNISTTKGTELHQEKTAEPIMPVAPVYATKIAMAESVVQPVIEQVNIQEPYEMYELQSMPINEYLQPADAILELAAQDASQVTQQTMPHKQGIYQLQSDMHNLDIPAFLRQTKYDENLLEPLD
jgi:cell division protein FtsZ